VEALFLRRCAGSTPLSLFTAVRCDKRIEHTMLARNRVSEALVVAGLLLIILSTGCGGVGTPGNHGTPPPASAHVFLVVEENHSYSQVIGNSSMPYLNSLAAKFGLATQYYADVHPSIGNYFMLTSGQVETLDDSFGGIVKDDNIVRELGKANKTWRSYAEDLPGSGYLGGDVYPYLRHHNPFTYFSDVQGTSQAGNVVPFSQFSSDLSGGTVPDFSFIVPNALNDAHDGTLAAADHWLKTNIAPLVASSALQNGGLLIIVFDESVLTDLSHGGGHVTLVLVGPHVKGGFQGSTIFQHQSTLRLVLSTLGVKSFPGASAAAPDMGEFFK
jgi:acid phosphatase